MSTATLACTQCRTPFGETALFCAHCGSAKPRLTDLAHDDLIGKVLGERFTILHRIGGGVSGVVYRAEHVTLRRKVAVKVLHHELSRDDLAIERFRREATTVAEIDNEHIVEIHDFGRTHDGRLYMAMELLEGESLDAILLREHQLSVERTTDILIQVSEALMEAHAIGYVHRDLRPRNIFLAVRRGQANFVKLLDFGLAKLVDPDQQAASTSLGMTFGDPRYMSPEQARGDRIDRRADIYQLGCVAYEMLTGHPPFTGDRVFDILSKHVTDAPAPLPTKRPGIPLWIEATATRMLAKNPDNRFATTSRLVEALRRGAATGEIMDEEVARRRESVPPASVSRVMQKLGLPLAEDVAPAPALAALVPTATFSSVASTPATAVNTRSTQFGTPSLAPATEELSDATHLGVPQQSNQGTKETAKGLPAVPRTGGPTGTPYAGTAAIVETISGYSNAPASPAAPGGPVAMMLPAMPPTAAMPIPQVIEITALPTPAVAAPAPLPPTVAVATSLFDAGPAAGSHDISHAAADYVADQPGVSSIWFAQGEQPDQSAPLPRRARRNSYSNSATDIVEAPKRSKRRWIVGGILLLLSGTALALVATSGSDKKPAVVAIVPVDAPSAVTLDALPPDASIDAALAVPTRPSSGGPSKTNTGTGPTATSEFTPPNRPSSGDPILDRRPPVFKPDAAPTHSVVKTPVGTQNPANNGVSGTDQTLDPYANSATAVITTNNGGSNVFTGAGPNVDDPLQQAESLAFIGEQALASGDAGGAAANFRKALELHPRNVAATLGLGELALQQGSFGDAAAHFRKATRLAPRSSRAFTLLGEAQLGNGNKDNAAESFKQALTLDADNARARNGYQDATR